jgi:uncharacterized protein (TIGR00661 family)
MRILYGVVGEGMGHATRSRVAIDHLIHEEGHEVEVVVSGRAHAMLEKHFPDVHKIWGLSMAFENAEFKVWRSLLRNLKQAVTDGIDENLLRYFEITSDFDPECVISDFESWSYLYGKAHDLPVLCVDNIQMMSRCLHDPAVLDLHRKDYELAKNFTKTKLARSEHYYITTFYYPEVRKPRTTLVPSILRNEILGAQPSDGEHVLVYQTSTSCADLPDILRQFDDVPFKVYGYRRDIDGSVAEGHVTYCPFSETGFMEDLASARAVITNGGFTLMSEAVYLHKPVLSIPLAGQFEQVLNAHYLEKLGYGYGNDILDAHTIRHFLGELPRYRENLEGYRQEEGNGVLFGLLDERLDRIAAGIE